MKKLMCVFTLLSILCSLFGCGDSKEEAAKKTGTVQNMPKWEAVTTIQHQKNIYSTGFFNKSFGVAVGYNGLIEYTNDGGKTWSAADNTSLCRFGLDMVSESVGYTCGNGGQITKTTDGAKTWKHVADFGDSEPDECTILSFISENVGMVAAAKKLAVTKDGGTSWVEITPPVEIVSLQLVSEKDCYIVGKDKMFYKSTDGGQNWEKRALNLSGFTEFKTNLKSMAVHMKEDGNGELVCLDENGTVKAYKTEDNGEAWTEEGISDVTGQSFVYISKDGGIVTLNDSTGREVTVLERK